MLHVRSVLGLAVGVALASLVSAASAQACQDSQRTAAVRSITVDQLASVMESHHGVTVIDANGPDTRAKLGVIPGAHLLSHYANYDPAKELPADKSAILVFYCASTKCTAAPTAAKKALESGHSNVYVLEVGIKGWTDAGKPTKPVANTTT